MDRHDNYVRPTLETLMQADAWARAEVMRGLATAVNTKPQAGNETEHKNGGYNGPGDLFAGPGNFLDDNYFPRLSCSY